MYTLSQAHIPQEEAVNQASQEASKAAMGTARAGGDKEMSIPKEVWRIVDALWTSGGATENDIFVVSADPGLYFTYCH